MYQRKNTLDKYPPEKKLDLVFDLVNSFKYLKNASEIADFLEDLLSPSEIRNLSIRLRIAKLLLKGQLQRDICVDLKTSPVTVNKVNTWLNKGGKGFKKVIASLPLKWKMPSKLPHGPIEFHLPEYILATGEYLLTKSQNKIPEKLITNSRNK